MIRSSCIWAATAASAACLVTPLVRAQPAFSPDGGSLAIDARVGGSSMLERRDLFVVALRRRSFRRVTFSKAPSTPSQFPAMLQYSAGSPTWSPDGKWLAYCEQHVEFSGSVYTDYAPRLVSADGRKNLAVSLGPRVWASNMGIGWSPDGRTLAIAREHHGDPAGPLTDIWLYELASRQARKAGSLRGWLSSSPAWSPKGGKILLGTGGPYVFDLKRGRTTKIRAGWPFAWSPDGRWLAYVVGVPGRRGTTAVWSVSADGRRGKRVGVCVGELLSMCWPRRSTMSLAVRAPFRPGKASSVRFGRLDVRTGRVSTALSVHDRVERPSWSRDGRKCAYWTREPSAPERLRLLDLRRRTLQTIRVPLPERGGGQ